MPTKINIGNESELFLKQNYEELGYKRCAEVLGISPRLCRRKAGALGLCRPLNKKFNKLSEAQIEFIKNNYKLLGPRGCAKAIGITEGHVGKIGVEYDICMDKKYNHSILLNNLKNVSSPEMAYVLGLLWADGTVSKYSLRINLIQKDMKNIEHIFDATGEWGKYYHTYKNQPTWKTQKILSITNKETCDYLKSLDYNKKSIVSPSKVLNIIPEDLKYFWWRGFFDGDGCIHIKLPYKHFCLAGSFEQSWLDTEILMTNLLVNDFKIRRTKHKNGKWKSSTFNLGGKNSILKFFNYIYPNYIFDDLGLKRKFEKFKLLLEGKPGQQSSIYKYIKYDKRTKCWVSQIRINKKYIKIGSFGTEKEAVLAKNKYILENALNFPIDELDFRV